MPKHTRKSGRIIAFTGGRILTMDPEKNNAEAVIIQDGRIVDVGDKSILKAYPGVEVVDLGGKALLPAFIDPHNHLSLACFIPGWVKLDGLADKASVLEAIRKHARAHGGKGWIVGLPWLDTEGGGAALTRLDLDEACPDRPVLLIHGTCHKAIVNTAALKLSGIDRSFRDSRNGMVLRDAGGEPTGVLLETAMASAFKCAFDVSTDAHANAIEARARGFLAYGITAVGDPGVTPVAEAAYQYLHSHKRLPISVLMMPHGETLLDNRLGSRLDGPVTGTGDELLRVGPVKIFADGGVLSTTAFSGKIAGTIRTLGLPRDDFEDVVIEATKRGFRVCAHSLGNASTEALIDVFEKAAEHVPKGFEMRPRIDHLFLMGEPQIRRFAALGGCTAVQPHYVAMARAVGLLQVPFEGFDWFPFDGMAKGGMVLAASSDSPCFGSEYAIEPLKCAAMGANIDGAIGKVLTPDHRSAFEQWLWMCTAGAAYVSGLENERGMLKKGLVADLVILDGELDPKKPPFVAETWKAGELVYKKGGI